MTPVVYSAAAQALVDAYNARPDDQKSGEYWKDESLAELKAEIKDHYIGQQQHRCAYCRQPTYSENKALWDAEHIISKQNNPEFMFEPLNLAISCKDCNIAKGEQEVRVRKKASFSSTSPEYKIVHPHFDNYAEHIGWMGTVVFAKTRDKGSKTISMCNLTRFSAIRLSETTNIMDDDFNRLMGQLMEAKTMSQAQVAIAGVVQVLNSKMAAGGK